MRNPIVLVSGLFRDRVSPLETVRHRFLVTPLDVGLATLKSDRYFSLAESAQLDFVTRTGLLIPLVRSRTRWINLSQAGVFQMPLRLMQLFTISTRVICIDQKHAYFSHRFTSSRGEHATVFVKLKFKRGAITVAPQSILGTQSTDKPVAVQALDAVHHAP